MSARVHRSEAPIPHARRPAQRQREALEARGQLELDLAPPRRSATAPPYRARPTPAGCMREPWRAFE
ncbi:MAG: hypothetical protein E6J87_22825 [Deltaproteobacteria bacterium]|nr:MAG: hypothetical protein E6J87_22825 [Deltaproteobacteria bacterium]